MVYIIEPVINPLLQWLAGFTLIMSQLTNCSISVEQMILTIYLMEMGLMMCFF